MEAKPTVPVTVCDTDIMLEIETIFDTLERGDAENDVAGDKEGKFETVAIVNEAIDVTVCETVGDAVYETVTLDDNVCTVDGEGDGVRIEVPEN